MPSPLKRRVVELGTLSLETVLEEEFAVKPLEALPILRDANATRNTES